MGAVEIVAGNRRLATFRQPASRRALGQPVARLRVVTAGCLAAICLATVLVGSWTPTLRPMLQARQQPPLWSATQWLANNVPRDRVLVVHDSIWTDLVHHYGFDPSRSSSTSSTPTRRSAGPCAASTTWPCRTGTTPPRSWS